MKNLDYTQNPLPRCGAAASMSVMAWLRKPSENSGARLRTCSGLLQLHILRPSLLQNRNIRISILPKRKKILISGKRATPSSRLRSSYSESRRKTGPFHRRNIFARYEEAGVPFSVVSEIMGWSASTAVRMTKRYPWYPARPFTRILYMGKTLRTGVFILTFAFWWAGFLTAQVQPTNADHDQPIFAEDDERFDNSVSIPQGVLRVLLGTEDAKEALEFANDRERKNVSQLFRAAEIHLAQSHETALLVLGVPPMCGVDNAWFWIVLSPRIRPKLVLFAGGNSVELMNTRSSGYADIRSRWSSPQETCTRVYRFNGRSYRLWKKRCTQNPN